MKTLRQILFSIFILALFALNQNPASAQDQLKDQITQINSYYQKPIPKDISGKSARTYHDIPIDLSNPLSKEPLQDLSAEHLKGTAYYARVDGLNAPYHACICKKSKLKLRKTVLKKLKHVNDQLASLGIELYVLDAYRPISCQTALWKYFMKEARASLGKDASEAQCIDYASDYCSNPTNYQADNPKTWPTHLTGAAVDITLCEKKSGSLLYMGGIFDDASEISHSSYFENSEVTTHKSASDEEATRNRRLLYWAMTEAGFANYPKEWWHFDFGNQMWVQNQINKNDSKAFYGAI